MSDPLEPENPLPPNAFPLENSSITEAERKARQTQTAPPMEDKDSEAAFPLENAGIITEEKSPPDDRFPLENSGITIQENDGVR